MASTMRAVRWACPSCGLHDTALYENGDRAYGDLPTCRRGCSVPFQVLDAIASWLDERGMQGEGDDVKPSKADLCGFTESRR